jgi:hypothetical protein
MGGVGAGLGAAGVGAIQPAGAESVSFEGIQCGTGERREFAYGSKSGDSGAWSPARGSAWWQIGDSRSNRHYYEFWRDVLRGGKMTEPRAAIVKHIAAGGRLRQPSSASE